MERKVQKKKTAREKMHDCGQFFWNSETKQFLGRGGKSWARIGLFYLVYYGSLAAFFAVCLTGFYQTLDNQAPTQKGMYSLLKQNPGMGFRPISDEYRNTYIKFNANNSNTYSGYVNILDQSLKVYENVNTGDGSNVINCSEVAPGKRNDSMVCNFEVSMLGNRCTKELNYGYPEGKPCVLLKLNKIYGWSPIPFDNETLNLAKPLGDRIDANYVGVTCDGETDTDVDNIRNVTYYPDKGFPSVFYPYFNQPGYLAPVVMAQFEVVPGRLVMIWCRAWAKNIKHHRVDLQGSVHFELLVDIPRS